jgi:hypothetical protein
VFFVICRSFVIKWIYEPNIIDENCLLLSVISGFRHDVHEDLRSYGILRVVEW